MGKKKIKIEHLKNTRTRQLTFAKRKKGLLKKAMELSILCNANIFLHITSPDLPNDTTIFSTEDASSVLKHLTEDSVTVFPNKKKCFHKEEYFHIFASKESDIALKTPCTVNDNDLLSKTFSDNSEH